MKKVPWGVLLWAVSIVPPSLAADEALLARLATCEDSWLEWRNDPVRMKRLADEVTGSFDQQSRSPGFAPKAPTSVLGLPVSELFPESVGMGVGFSISLKATFEQARRAVEQRIGKPMKCERGDGMNSCEVKLGDKRNAVVVAPDARGASESLIGCFYLYAK